MSKIYRTRTSRSRRHALGGTMVTNSSPISANTPNNCVGSAPAVPTCTG